MTVERIEFRCDRCGKRLSASSRSQGKQVACPQCGSKLEIPLPATVTDHASLTAALIFGPEGETNTGDSNSSRDLPQGTPSPAAELVTREGERAADSLPFVQVEPVSLRETRTPTWNRREKSVQPTRSSEPTEVSEFLSSSTKLAAAESEAQPAVSTEILEGTVVASIRDNGSASGRQVSLSQSAIMLWSMLVILAIAFAFMTGLLIGRFLWAPGIRLNGPPPSLITMA
jgi:DNA-directed RNA polymerase subunit RPC12/RpoP